MSGASQIPVRIDGEFVDVWVARSGTATWTAYATFRGRYIQQNGSSQSNALDKWREAADYLSKD